MGSEIVWASPLQGQARPAPSCTGFDLMGTRHVCVVMWRAGGRARGRAARVVQRTAVPGPAECQQANFDASNIDLPPDTLVAAVKSRTRPSPYPCRVPVRRPCGLDFLASAGTPLAATPRHRPPRHHPPKARGAARRHRSGHAGHAGHAAVTPASTRRPSGVTRLPAPPARWRHCGGGPPDSRGLCCASEATQ